MHNIIAAPRMHNILEILTDSQLNVLVLGPELFIDSVVTLF